MGDWAEILRTLALTGGAVLGAIGIWLALRRTRSLETQAETDRKRLEHQSEEDKQKRYTDNFTRAVDQLGSEQREVRLGAIYALERIARESKDDHWPIMETLTAYVRERSPWPPEPGKVEGTKNDPSPNTQDSDADETPDTPPVDIQAVVTVIGRRQVEHEEKEQWLDFSQADLRAISLAFTTHADLSRAKFSRSNLQEANLDRANLQKANLRGANLQRANLEQANLQEANLWGANLQRANLEQANLQEALLDGANLQKANLQRAKLQEAGLWRANLQEADLQSANLQWVNLERANLQGAILQGANLQKAYLKRTEKLTQEQLDQACGDENTGLPEGLTIKPCSEAKE